jgi:hypothetical protein
MVDEKNVNMFKGRGFDSHRGQANFSGVDTLRDNITYLHLSA